MDDGDFHQRLSCGSGEKYDFLLLNCQGLSSRKAGYIEAEYVGAYRDLKFLVFTETWCRDSSHQSVHFGNFVCVSNFNRIHSVHGGAGIWCRKDISNDVKTLDLGRFCTEREIELCGVLWKPRNGHFKNIHIIACYRPEKGSDGRLNSYQMFCDRLTMLFDFFCKRDAPLIFCGDINYDKFKDKKEYEGLKSLLSAYNLVNYVSEPTRLGSYLDHIYANFQIQPCKVVSNYFSDHDSVFAQICPLVEQDNGYYIYRRQFSESNISRFYASLLNENWDGIIKCDDVNQGFRLFFRSFHCHFDAFFPSKKVCCRPDGRQGWVSDEVRISSVRLKNLFELKRKYPQFTTVYKRASVVHKQLINKTKKEFYQSLIAGSDCPAKTAWGLIRKARDGHQNFENHRLFADGGVVVDDPTTVANLFNDFFVDAPLEIYNNIQAPMDGGCMGPGLQKNFYLFPYAEDELISLITKKLKTKSSSGPDAIPSSLVKKIFPAISAPLCHIINISFSSGTFPDSLKVTKIIPVLKKKADKRNVENYRPIALTSCFSKIFEYAFLNRLLPFLKQENILSNCQFGFQPNLSTTKAIGNLVERVVFHLENGECPVGLFLDLSRAFDCVPHKDLLLKLESYGIRGVSATWIRGFLTDREQYVSVKHSEGEKFGDVPSDVRKVSMGVPQGSVLGPVLFILYVNDLVGSLGIGAAATLYADDTSVIISGNKQQLEERCQSSLDNLQNWFSYNHLSLNSKKTEFLHFHSVNSHTEEVSVKINDHLIKKNNTAKFLGVMLDSQLHWKDHCCHLSRKLNSMCYLFRNLRCIMRQDQLLQLYHAEVDSRLRYGLCFWGMSADSPNVFISQKRIVRAIAGVDLRTTCRPLFKSYKIMTLYSLLIYELGVYVFENGSSFVLNMDVHNVNTRSGSDIRLPFKRLGVGQRLPSYLGPKIFNKLPVEVRGASTICKFKNSLRAFLLEECFYSLGEFLNK